MSFNGTKTPLKPTGKAKWQIPMRESPKCKHVMEYYLEGELKEKFIKLYPRSSNRRMMEWFGISFSTLRRFARGLGLEKDMKAIRHQLAKDVKKICEKSGYYDSLRGKPMPVACQEGRKRLRDTGFHPMKALKEKSPRRYKNILRKRSDIRKELFRKERMRAAYGLERKTKLRIPERPINGTASSFKSMLIRKRNYFSVPGHTWWIAYDKDTDRLERSEATARKHGFEIVEGEDDTSEPTETLNNNKDNNYGTEENNKQK